jgi:transcriptional regulator with XRE-family HTH domain/quercetin dioxygenase-like cupin family protein
VSSIPPVGQRIREVRLHRGLSLRGLARAVGVSASLVSQIETGKSQPSVSTLYAITKALNISVEDVFDTDADEGIGADGAGSDHGPGPGPGPGPVPGPDAQRDSDEVFDRIRDQTVGGALEADIGPGPGREAAERRVGPLVPSGDREVLELDSGVTWERLGRVPGTPVDFLLVTYPPGGSSSGTDRLMRHSGVEYGYLISGELTLTLGFDEYRLRPGDAVSFPSTTPHRYSNGGTQPAVGVWFVDDSGSGVH